MTFSTSCAGFFGVFFFFFFFFGGGGGGRRGVCEGSQDAIQS